MARTQTVNLTKLALSFTLPADWTGASQDLRFDAHSKAKDAALTIQGVTTKLSLAAIGKSFANAEKAALSKTDAKATVVRQQTTIGGIPVVKVTIHYRGTWGDLAANAAQTHFVWTYKRGPRAYIVDFSTLDSVAAKTTPQFVASIRSLRFTGGVPSA